jgi:hypothetical protein
LLCRSATFRLTMHIKRVALAGVCQSIIGREAIKLTD